MTTVARKNGIQTFEATSMQSHMDSIHSPHNTRKTIMKLCMKSTKFQRGISLDGNLSVLSAKIQYQYIHNVWKWLKKSLICKRKKRATFICHIFVFWKLAKKLSKIVSRSSKQPKCIWMYSSRSKCIRTYPDVSRNCPKIIEMAKIQNFHLKASLDFE